LQVNAQIRRGHVPINCGSRVYEHGIEPRLLFGTSALSANSARTGAALQNTLIGIARRGW
jgi:hypothetical protein